MLSLFLAPPVASGIHAGKLRIKVTPKQAYVFVDGHPIVDSSRLLWMAPGEHSVSVQNYGYKTETRSVTLEPKKTVRLDVNLEPVPGTASGPWGRLQLQGGPRHAAVLLNGKTPEYFVGHIDEFDHNFIWKQQLLVPPGAHQITILRQGDGQEIFSRSVTVMENQRVILNLKNGDTKIKSWPSGGRLISVPRFSAGLASTTVAVAKPKAELSASTPQIGCGDSALLKWTSLDAPHVEITGVGPVATLMTRSAFPASGEETIKPKQTTTYTLKASGPGGEVESSATVNVNNSIQATLSLSPSEARFRRVGDRIAEQGSTTLNWSTGNASSVSIDGLGPVGATGSRELRVLPRRNSAGPVDETINYTLSATNPCGVTETRTATLHITGAVEAASIPAAAPAPKSAKETQLEVRLAMNSIYFPTAQPTAKDPQGGLVPSQQRILTSLASDFLSYLKFRPGAHLILQSHADTRGSKEANQALSERRAARTRTFLVAHGVPAESIETRAHGNEQNLSADQIERLIETNPDLTAEERQKLRDDMSINVLANNRRVDVTLSTTGQESVRLYPYKSADAASLMSAGGAAPKKPRPAQARPARPQKKK